MYILRKVAVNFSNTVMMSSNIGKDSSIYLAMKAFYLAKFLFSLLYYI